MVSELDQKLINYIAQDQHDPLKFAQTVYPWGKGELAGSAGPRKWQAETLDLIGKHLRNPQTRFTPLRIARASGHGIGKVMSNVIEIDTPDGKKGWGDLNEGDLVFGKDGRPVRIVAKYPHEDWDFYKITFSDGTHTFAGLEHLWSVTTKRDRDSKRAPRIVTTEEMLGNLHRSYQIPMSKPVEYPFVSCVIHPYLMGYILGNGSVRTTGAVRVSCHDEELYDYMQTLLPPEHYFRGDEKNYKHISANGEGSNKIYNELVSLDMHGKLSIDKSIPDLYKYNNSECRIALLCGLMDSDGTISPRSGDNGRKGYKVQFSTSSPQLRDDMIWLVRSLGGCASFSTDKRRHLSNGIQTQHDNFEVHINLPREIIPFRLTRKKEMYEDFVSTVKRDPIRRVCSIEYDHTGEGHCITVDASDSLYLANDFIVTHNTGLISMLVHWAMSTCVDCKVVVTANTEKQLLTKTWPEISKWFRLAINSHWFKVTATSISAVDKAHDRTWRADAIPWSDTNTESFAGLHNKGRRILVIMDEGSAIDDKIYNVVEGALTDEDTEIIWVVFGNPTRNTGRFRELFGRFKHRWNTAQIDSRTVEGTNKAQLDEWAKDYGEDSDFFKVRVRGEFPSAGSMQFVPSHLVEDARRRQPEARMYDPFILGVDVARFGDDETVMCIRRGRDAQSIPWVTMRGADTMQVAAKVADLYDQYKFDAIFVDGGGVGGGVIDRLRMLKYPCIEVQFGAKPDRNLSTEEGPVVYANKRAEMYGYMKDWLKGGMIPDDPDLASQLISVEYGYVSRQGKDMILLEKKSDMKKRGLASPDKADALCLTFAYPVMPSDHRGNYTSQKSQHQIDYSPLAKEHLQSGGRHYNHLIDYSPIRR